MAKINFEVSKAEVIDDTNEHFSIAKIHAFSSGDNRHDLWCDVETLKATAPTIYEKPIVFDVDELWDDFSGHNEDGKPRIAGFVVNDSAEFSELEDGRTALEVRVKIWKYYAEDFMRIFRRDNGKKKVSVEMDLKSVGEEDSRGFKQMVDWAYSAICVLGDLITEASPNANMQMLSFSEYDDKEKYFDTFAKYDHIDFKIPSKVKENAKKGLELRKEYGRGGTSVGMATARYLVKNPVASPQKVREIARHFPRHAGNNLDDKTSNGWIAFLLWGSHAGWKWSEKIVNQMNKADEKMMAYFDEDVKESDVMPYKSMKDVNPAIKGITPPVSLAQANQIAKQADAVPEKEGSSGWAIAIASFKKSHVEKDGKWVKKMEMASDEDDAQEQNLLAEGFASGKEETDTMEKDEKEMESEEAEKDTFETDETKAESKDENVMMEDAEEESEEEEAAEKAPPETSGEGDESEPEEEMAMNGYQRIGEMLAMLEKDTADFSFGEDTYPVLDNILDKFSVLQKERDALFEYKESQEKAQKNFMVDATIAEIKEYVPANKIEELRTDAENFSLENIDGWKNKAQAIAFSFSKGSDSAENDGIVKYQFPISAKDTADGGSIWDKIGN